jgi:hypothetical protein
MTKNDLIGGNQQCPAVTFTLVEPWWSLPDLKPDQIKARHYISIPLSVCVLGCCKPLWLINNNAVKIVKSACSSVYLFGCHLNLKHLCILIKKNLNNERKQDDCGLSLTGFRIQPIYLYVHMMSRILFMPREKKIRKQYNYWLLDCLFSFMYIYTLTLQGCNFFRSRLYVNFKVKSRSSRQDCRRVGEIPVVFHSAEVYHAIVLSCLVILV